MTLNEGRKPARTIEEKRAYQREWARQWRKKNPERSKQNALRSHEKHKEKRLAMSRDWKARNIEKRDAYRAEYYAKNKERELEQNKLWIEANKEQFKETKRQVDKKYRLENREKIQAQRFSQEAKQIRNARERLRYATDTSYRIEKTMRAAFTQALRLHGEGRKTQSIHKILGCSISNLVEYLEGKFKPGMSWENYGQWHIDHIVPCAHFDLACPAQQQKCFHFSNLQPLWAVENQSKGSLGVKKKRA